MLSTALKLSRLSTTFVVAVLLLSVVAGLGPAHVAAVGQTTATTLVVDGDGGADYRSIQAAVDAAGSGDTVEVRPGTYAEEVVVDETITLVAPGGATLDGSSIPARPAGITIPPGSGAEPVVVGFEIRGYYDGVNASRTTGAWTVRNATITESGNDGLVATASAGAWTVADATLEGNGDEGIDAENTTGSWTVRNTTIVDSGDDAMDVDGSAATAAWTVQNSTLRQTVDDGIDADDGSGAWTVRGTTITGTRSAIQALNTTGDWTIRGSILRNNTNYGVTTFQSTGNWTIADSHVRYHSVAGVEAARTTGAWTIRDSTIHDASVGVHAGSSTGAWTVTNSTVRNTSVPAFDVTGEGTGVYAGNTTGAWAVHGSNLAGHAKHGLNATGAAPPGDATGNWWDQPGGPAGDDCVGNVDCGDALPAPADVASPPTVGPGYFTESAGPLPGGVGLPSIAIIVSLVLVLVVLGTLSWRIT